MKVNVTKERVVIEKYSPVNENELNVNTCKFQLPECFKELNVTAVFNDIPVPVLDNMCVIPSLKQGTASLGVFAYKEDGGVVRLMYSPTPTFFSVNTGSYTENLKSFSVPEIGEFEEYCRRLYEALKKQLNEQDDEIVFLEESADFKYNEEYGERFAEINTAKFDLRQGEYYMQMDNDIYRVFVTLHKERNLYEIRDIENNMIGAFIVYNGNVHFMYEEIQGQHYIKLFKRKKENNCEVSTFVLNDANECVTAFVLGNDFSVGDVNIKINVEKETVFEDVISVSSYRGILFGETDLWQGAADMFSNKRFEIYITQDNGTDNAVSLYVCGQPERITSEMSEGYSYLWKFAQRVDV